MRAKSTENKSYWTNHVKAYKASGLNKNRYCSKQAVSYHRFLYWFEKLTSKTLQPQKDNKSTIKAKNQFIKVKLDSKSNSVFNHPSSSIPLCILELKQGHRLLVHNEAILEKLFLLLSK